MNKNNFHLVIFFFAFLSLISGILSGWERIGWNIDLPELVANHGTIMAAGFFGTLLMLEKCLGMPSKKYLLIPFLNGTGIFFLFFGFVKIALINMTIASVAMCAVAFEMKRLSKQNLYWIVIAGFACLFGGDLTLLLTGLFPSSVIFWMSFLLFIIVSERLELTRFLSVSEKQKQLLWIALSMVFIGIIPYHYFGKYLFAFGMAGIALWLMKFDIAFKSLRQTGQSKFSAVTMIGGYLWLFVSAFYILKTDSQNHFDYDALLHSFFLGFTFSMIFAHVPIIFPALFKLKIKLYHPFFYVVMILMNLTVLMRIVSDEIQNHDLRKWSGLLNGLVIFLFFATVILVVFSSFRSKTQES